MRIGPGAPARVSAATAPALARHGAEVGITSGGAALRPGGAIRISGR
jgi:hypothetical protein